MGKRTYVVGQPRLCPGCQLLKLYTKEFFPACNKNKSGLLYLCRTCNSKRYIEINHRSSCKLRRDVLTGYSPTGKICCACCGESYLEFLVLDHIHGGGCKERRKYARGGLWRKLRKEGYPPGYRVLCQNCNASLGLYGYCPHKPKELVKGAADVPAR